MGIVSQSITANFLRAHGFQQSPNDPSIFQRANVQVAEIARELGLDLRKLRAVKGQRLPSDMRTLKVGRFHFVFRSRERRISGQVIVDSLDKPDSVCDVSISLTPAQKPHFAVTAGRPDVRILSVKAPREFMAHLAMVVQLKVQGTSPIAFSPSQLTVYLRGPNGSPAFTASEVRCGDSNPQRIAISVGQARVLRLDIMDGFGTFGEWKKLAPSRYSLRVALHGNTKGHRDFDYQWIGTAYSELYSIVVPEETK
jgi:hypothetical protein